MIQPSHSALPPAGAGPANAASPPRPALHKPNGDREKVRPATSDQKDHLPALIGIKGSKAQRIIRPNPEPLSP